MLHQVSHGNDNMMFRVALLLIALVLSLFLNDKRRSYVDHQLHSDDKILVTHSGKSRHDNVPDGVTYSRTIVEFPDDGESDCCAANGWMDGCVS